MQTVVICGRPNVGKSSLFNSMVKRRVAIVDPTAGVTRDRVTARVERPFGAFEVVDTGGIGMVDELKLEHEVRRQIDTALALADQILFVVDAKEGLLPADEIIARELRGLGKPIILVANKCDGVSVEREVAPFYRLGLGQPRPVSALERYGVEALVESIIAGLPAAAAEDAAAEQPIRLAIVGKVNSGKSTLVNLLAGEERVIVSDLPGTTRDAVDVPFRRGGRSWVAVDTAGMRKRRVVEGTADYYGQSRAAEAIRRADAVLLLLDATREVSQIDKSIARAVAASARPVVVGVTKWDLAEAAGRSAAEYEPYVRQQLPMFEFAPLAFLSARTGFNVDATLELMASLHEQSGHRAATGPLNRIVEEAARAHLPRVGRGRFPKLFYATQTGVHPPTIVVFVNDRRMFGDEYARYLANRFRERLPFRAVPLRIVFRDRRGAPKE